MGLADEFANRTALTKDRADRDAAACETHEWHDVMGADGKVRRYCRACGKFYGYVRQA